MQRIGIGGGLLGWEHRLIERLGAASVGDRSLSFAVPLLMIFSLSVMFGAGPALLSRWTPFVGGAAVLIEALYLSRVSLRIAHAYLRRAAANGSAAARLRRVLWPVLNLLSGTMVFAGAFPFLAGNAIAAGAGAPAVARLLWLLTIGGLMVAIALGELMLLLVRSAGDCEARGPAG